MDWRRSFTDSAGEIWTPFASAARRRDRCLGRRTSRAFRTSCQTGETQALRVMPTVGLEYRYPFINVQPWGTTTIEPIVQVIARPNEPYAGKLPNEDAQSMTFDTSNLFSVDKFSGYDREEGGGRANVGVQTTTQFDRGGSVTAVFGQSYQLFGMNSFAVHDVTNTALDSGLDKPASDYVASINYSPNRTYTFTTRARFDEATGSVERFEAEGKANFDRWSVSLLYGDYAAAARIGIPDAPRRHSRHRLGQAGVKLGADRRRPLGSDRQPDQPIRHRRGLCGRLLRARQSTTSHPIPTPPPPRRRSSTMFSCCSSACGRLPIHRRNRTAAASPDG